MAESALLTWAKRAKGAKGARAGDPGAIERDEGGRFASTGSASTSTSGAKTTHAASSAAEVDRATLGAVVEERGLAGMDRLGMDSQLREAFPNMGAIDRLKLGRRIAEEHGTREAAPAPRFEQRGGLPGGVLPRGEFGTRSSNIASRRAARESIRRTPSRG